jgi:hypothetical protein
MFNSPPQFTIKAEKNKEFDKSCLIDTFNIGSGNIADCLEHCLENCRCQSFQICQNTKCQLCSSHKKENSSLLHDKDGCVYAMYEMRDLTEMFQVMHACNYVNLKSDSKKSHFSYFLEIFQCAFFVMHTSRTLVLHPLSKLRDLPEKYSYFKSQFYVTRTAKNSKRKQTVKIHFKPYLHGRTGRKKLGGRKEICPTFSDCALVVKKKFPKKTLQNCCRRGEGEK